MGKIRCEVQTQSGAIYIVWGKDDDYNIIPSRKGSLVKDLEVARGVWQEEAYRGERIEMAEGQPIRLFKGETCILTTLSPVVNIKPMPIYPDYP